MKYLNKDNFDKAYSVITSRGFMLLCIVVLILLFLRQCNETSHAETEAKREHNNYLATSDSVRTIKNDNGVLVQEKSAFEIKVSELTRYQKKLIEQLDLKSNGRGNTPKTVIQIVTEYRDNIIGIPSRISRDPNGKEYIDFVYAPELPGKNKLRISGKTPYTLGLFRDPKDSTKYLSSISPGGTDLSIEQNIEITTGLYRDPKTKRLMTRVSTTYPNLTFNEINSFDITDNKETKQALKSARKNFSFGLSFGYGIVGNSTGVGPGFYTGVSLNYSPKFLQFGK
jgi:hypothetical protein